MTAPPRWTHEAALAWAESMVPALAERAIETERIRELTPDTIADCELVDAFSLVSPARVGGHGLGLDTLTDVTRTLARGCASSAWTISFLMLHNWFVARCDEPLQQAVWGDSASARIPCPLAPTGTAIPVEGGYRVTGRWSWATGVQHGDWVMVNTFVQADPAPGGLPESRFCLIPIASVEVIDVWHTAGMRGTGSNDVACEDLFVPEQCTVVGADLRADSPPGALVHPEPFTSYAFTPVLCMVAASPALGAAEAAVDIFCDYAAERVLPYSLGDLQVEQQGSQIRLAEARATVRAARLVWQDAIDTIIAAGDNGTAIEPVDRAPLRLAAAHVVKLARQAVTIATEGCGASIYFETHPLQRIQRDLETIKGHVVYDWDRVAALAGKIDLGIAPTPFDML